MNAMDEAHIKLAIIPSVSRRRRFLMVLGLMVLAAAWIVFFVGWRQAYEFREKLGPGVEVYDALARDYAAGRVLESYAFAALGLDLLAFLIVYFAHAERECLITATLLWSLVWVASFGWHGLALLGL
jgi:hypothetical protein